MAARSPRSRLPWLSIQRDKESPLPSYVSSHWLLNRSRGSDWLGLGHMPLILGVGVSPTQTSGTETGGRVGAQIIHGTPLLEGGRMEAGHAKKQIVAALPNSNLSSPVER